MYKAIIFTESVCCPIINIPNDLIEPRVFGYKPINKEAEKKIFEIAKKEMSKIFRNERKIFEIQELKTHSILYESKD